MPQYKAPIEDIQFNLHDWLKITEHYKRISVEDAADSDLVNQVVEEAAKFAENVLSPLNYPGDQQGCQFHEGEVKTPEGFVEAYRQYCEAGWSSLEFSPEYGGQGLPHSLAVVCAEMNTAANTSWSMYPGLTHGVIAALSHHADDEIKQQYLPNLISGRWTGSMCLTEPHCGSDLGLLKTKAIPNDDGSYRISGTKIFISAGEHDMSENIIHLVLARLPDAPSGSAGISLFLVPKKLNSESQKTDNNVFCGSIEHKMGIKASATCVLNFEESKGFLIGPPNKGLACMFTMMNVARLATGVQGYAIATLSHTAALDYAKERLQMRSLRGPQFPDKAADPIIVHPDVRRMLMTQKAFTEGCRGLAYYVATLVDQIEAGKDETGAVEAELSLLTPICKAFMSEVGFESCSLGVQVLGGHGYIAEWEMEQLVRDARIAMIYEGTNGIQALDLLGRKVLRDQGKALQAWVNKILAGCEQAAQDERLAAQAGKLKALALGWLEAAQQIGARSAQDPEWVGAAAFDFLMYAGYVTVAHILLQQAMVAQTSSRSDSFKLAKLQTCRFYFERLLPRAESHRSSMIASLDSLQCESFKL